MRDFVELNFQPGGGQEPDMSSLKKKRESWTVHIMSLNSLDEIVAGYHGLPSGGLTTLTAE